MRQRKIKEIDKKINEFEKFLVREPEKQRGNWRGAFGKDSSAPEVFAEIGCGKGRFITGQASRNPEKLYIGFEGNETVIYRALQKVALLDESNHAIASHIKFCSSYIYEPRDIFEENELDGMFLNFSDPWPKTRHEKRRLTQQEYINGYVHSISKGGILEFKTDNEDFFRYSLENFKKEKGFDLDTVIEDIQKSEQKEYNVETEYEHKFNNLRRKIKFLRVIKV